MTLIIGKLKCEICEQKGGVLQSIHDYGIYGDVGKRHFFHQECVVMIEKDPERFGHRLIDKVLNLRTLEQKNKEKINNNLEKDFEEKVQKCRTNLFERMIPGKK